MTAVQATNGKQDSGMTAMWTFFVCGLLVAPMVYGVTPESFLAKDHPVPTISVDRYDSAADVLRPGAVLFGDRPYVLSGEAPTFLHGLKFVRSSIERTELICETEGVLYVLSPAAEQPRAASQERRLLELGFTRLPGGPFPLWNTSPRDAVCVYYKHLADNESVSLGKWAIAAGPAQMTVNTIDHEPKELVLYNGIELPAVWPPRDMADYDFEPLPVPYLENVPEVIPIDIGRQLFVDDFLIENTSLTRTYHAAKRHPANPVLTPETELERGLGDHVPMAAPFSGGVWFDPADGLFKMWYHAGWMDGTAYAFSEDGLDWQRPELDVEPGTNRVIPFREGVLRDSCAVVLDHWADDPQQRFKLFLWSRPVGGEVYASADGIHWGEPTSTLTMRDRSTIFYNPFRDKWVYSMRAWWHARSREYAERDDLIQGAATPGRVKWLRADRLDIADPNVNDVPQLYNFDAVAYESIMLGAFLIHMGPHNQVCNAGGFPKLTDIHLGFSRDGFHWSRPQARRPFIAGTQNKNDWDRAYLQSSNALCLVMGDELWFYYTGFQGDATLRDKEPHAAGFYANASTGIATLRRDGFASMDAQQETGILTTRPVTFGGNYLFVNVDAPDGQLKVDILDKDGQPIEGFTADLCRSVSTDSTLTEVRWRGKTDLSALQNTPVRFRFHLTDGKLYAFWVSPDRSGASYGYVAGGGPGFTGPTDTVGRGGR